MSFKNFDRTKNIQDQLQEMVKGHPLEKIDSFHTFCMWDENYEDLRENLLDTSLEQLWLAFVMKERFNKVWSSDKNEWVSHSK